MNQSNQSNQSNEANQVFVGIDVSKAQLDVGLWPNGQAWRVEHTVQAVEGLVAQLLEHSPALVVLEASGGLEAALTAELAAAGLTVAVVNPRQVRDFARAVGKLAKTDKVDAAVLARFAQAVRPEARALPDERAVQLRAVLVRRRQLVEMLTMERNRLTASKSLRVREGLQAHIRWLEAHVSELDKELERRLREDEVWRDRWNLLLSVPGVGRVLAATVLLELPELGGLSGKQLAALVGVAPFNRDSGTLKGQRAVWGGRAPVRAVLYMATVAAVRCNPAIRAVYQRLTGAGKAKKVALTACMRKLLVVLNAMVRSGQGWTDRLAAPPDRPLAA